MENSFWQNYDTTFFKERFENAVNAFETTGEEFCTWLKKHSYPLVGIFGSAKNNNGTPSTRGFPDYQMYSKKLGMLLAQNKFALLTGGCEGLPGKVVENFIKYRTEPQKQPVIGLRIWPGNNKKFQGESHMDFTIGFPSFGPRIELMEKIVTVAGIFFPGGIGTMLELVMFLQWRQFKKLTNRGKTAFLIGKKEWRGLIAQITAMAVNQTINKGEFDLRYHENVDKLVEELVMLNGKNNT